MVRRTASGHCGTSTPRAPPRPSVAPLDVARRFPKSAAAKACAGLACRIPHGEGAWESTLLSGGCGYEDGRSRPVGAALEHGNRPSAGTTSRSDRGGIQELAHQALSSQALTLGKNDARSARSFRRIRHAVQRNRRGRCAAEKAEAAWQCECRGSDGRAGAAGVRSEYKVQPGNHRGDPALPSRGDCPGYLQGMLLLTGSRFGRARRIDEAWAA